MISPSRAILLAATLAAAVARGQDSLDHLIAVALDQNQELAASRSRWDASKQWAGIARSLEDPMVGADVERSNSTGFNDYSDVEWMVSQKLPWLGRRGAKASAARLEAEATGFEYLELLRATRAKVKDAYWNLWLAQKAVDVNHQQVGLHDQFVKIARTRYETGQASQADLLRASVELARRHNDLQTLQLAVEVAAEKVNSLLNAEPGTPRMAGPAPALNDLELTLAEMQARARHYSCILLAQIRKAEAKEFALKAVRKETSPEFEFRVEARQFEETGSIDEYDTGIFMNVPWLWRGKYRAAIQGAQAELATARAELQSEINMTMLNIKELYTELDTARRHIELYEKSLLPQTAQLMDSTRAAYQAGTVGFLELMDTLHMQAEAQLELYRAQAAYASSYAKTEQIILPWGDEEIATGLVTKDMQ